MNAANVWTPILVASLVILLLPACKYEIKRDTESTPVVVEDKDADNLYWKKTRELYEKAKESGETVPEDVKEWVKEDIKKIGAFEYKIITLPVDDHGAIETALNEWGALRWDCFWADRRENEITFYLKKTSRSYLRALPAKELLKFIPLLGADGGGE